MLKYLNLKSLSVWRNDSYNIRFLKILLKNKIDDSDAYIIFLIYSVGTYFSPIKVILFNSNYVNNNLNLHA